MAFLDEIKKLTRPYNMEDDDSELMDESSAASPSDETLRPGPFGGLGVFGGSQARANGQSGSSPDVRSRKTREGRVTPLRNGENNSVTQFYFARPERFEDVRSIANQLIDQRSIVLNLEEAPETLACRVFDFLSGVAFALGGKVQRVAARTFLIMPYNAEISGQPLADMDNGGAYM